VGVVNQEQEAVPENVENGATQSKQQENAMKEKFLEKFTELCKAKNTVMLTEEEWRKNIEVLEVADVKGKKTGNQYSVIRKFVLLKRPDGAPLLGRRSANGSEPLIALSLSQSFDAISEVHKSTIHGGVSMMLAALHEKFWNVTQEEVKFFKSCCATCAKKAKLPSTSLVVKPVRSHNFGSRGQVDLFDLQSIRVKGYNWVLQYQDHFTKLSVLRPLKSKRGIEVAHALLGVFTEFGPPNILQSDNGREFVNQILDELKVLWPNIVIVNGRARHPQSQGSIERSNQDIKTMLATWCDENKTTDWTIALPFVQFAKNCRPHSTLGGMPPYEAVFGRKCEFGIPVDKLPEKLRDAVVRGEVITEEGIFSDSDSESDLHSSETNRVQITEQIEKAQQRQADRMLSRSRAASADIHLDDNVALAVDRVDRGPLDPPTITCVVLECTEAGFKLGCKAGKFDANFQPNMFVTLPEKLIHKDDVPATVLTSVRVAVKKLSNFGGQGYIRCGCTTTKCMNGKCKCRASKLACNSRCHPSRSCCNNAAFDDVHNEENDD
jgi:hypothetical protein